MQIVRANGIATAFSRVGQGPPLVLIHGGEADHSMFDAVARRLSGAFTVITYDQRDCGLTENPSAAYTLFDLADDLAALITMLGFAKAHVYGTSFGGIVAQHLAARHPECIDRLVLGSTWQAGRTPLDINPEAVRTLVALRRNPSAATLQIAEFFLPADYLQKHPAAVDLFRRGRPDGQRRERRQAVLLAVEAANMSRFSGPVLLLAGADDRLIPQSATFALKEHIANAKTMAIEGVAHAGAIHAPDRIAGAVADFLDAKGGRRSMSSLHGA